MYEELEMWNAEMAKTVKWIEENEQAKELFNECGFQYKEKAKQNVSKLVPLEYEYLLDELCTKEMSGKEFDKELDKLAKRL